MLIVINLSKDPAVFEVDCEPEMAQSMKEILKSAECREYKDGHLDVQMPGFGYLVAEY